MINTIQKKIEDNKGYIYNYYHIKNLGIFGSCISGELKEDSDIDILIQFEKGYKDFFNYMRLKYYLENLLGREVDLVMQDSVKPRLKERIFKEVKYV